MALLRNAARCLKTIAAFKIDQSDSYCIAGSIEHCVITQVSYKSSRCAQLVISSQKAGKYDSIDRHVVSPSLLAQFGTPPGKKPKCEFLLGLGEPFKPNPWDCDSDSINDADLLMALQVAEEEIPECKP